ncbi:endolytic transglycosylase MltG [uncultured Cohaesibacter sp.]|uniref:endolytic transglycosylase MltG n=1 Tax=uncultured Cohaesibacter sp. TaxID=1002546 RepID=UPI00292EEAE5|nr:endolytic transglycosylase MltG [uncultured Cohaesibacter sp.]
MVDGKKDENGSPEEQVKQPEGQSDLKESETVADDTHASEQESVHQSKSKADEADIEQSSKVRDDKGQRGSDAEDLISGEDSSQQKYSNAGELKAPRSARQAIEPDTPPPPPVRSKAVRHPVVVFLNFIITVFLLGVLAAGGLLYYGKESFIEGGPLTQERTILVSSGTGLATIADILERQNVISNKTIFEYGVRIYRQDAKLKAGEYLFSPGISMLQVMNILTSGKSILHSLTVPEGYTSFQIHQLINENEVLVGTLDVVPAEGTLLPETYKFSRGTTRQEIVKRMGEASTRAINEIWARRSPDLPIKTKQELVTLASIVEKETGKASERTRVAGVFINRLNQGMKLQSDPTVIYGLFGGEGKPTGRPIFRSDLDKKTDYNTYHITALPPGPIANPGRAALEAVANPSRTKELFFVADGTGGHVFSETLKQHNDNVKRWREIEKQRIEALKQKQNEAPSNETNGAPAASEEVSGQ